MYCQNDTHDQLHVRHVVMWLITSYFIPKYQFIVNTFNWKSWVLFVVWTLFYGCSYLGESAKSEYRFKSDIASSIFCFLFQVCSIGYYKSMTRCTECPSLPWLLIQMVAITFVIIILIFILARDERGAKIKGRTLSDIVLARLKIVIGFYQVVQTTDIHHILVCHSWKGKGVFTLLLR